MKQPLLSIIIPTKNRQHTCLFAIKTALLIDNDDFEIIIQDCSDTDVLRSQIIKELGDDKRIKYVHTSSQPSMTENWNMAIDRTSGEFLCAIGDDDIILEEVYELAKWAKANNAHAVQHTNTYAYYWPDVSTAYRRGKLLLKRKYTGAYTRIKDIKSIVENKAKNLDMGYMDGKLPMFYHSIISIDLLEKLKEKTNSYLDGSSLDVYTAFSLGLLCDVVHIFDYPFTIRGACGKSNSNRIMKKNMKEHFDEIRDNNQSVRVPYLNNLKSTIAESMLKAFSNLGREDLNENLNTPLLFAQYIVDNPRQYFQLRKDYLKAETKEPELIKLHQYIIDLWFLDKKNYFKRKMKDVIEIIPGLKKLNQKNTFQAKNAIEAVDLHKKYIKENKIQLELNCSELHDIIQPINSDA